MILGGRVVNKKGARSREMRELRTGENLSKCNDRYHNLCQLRLGVPTFCQDTVQSAKELYLSECRPGGRAKMAEKELKELLAELVKGMLITLCTELLRWLSTRLTEDK